MANVTKVSYSEPNHFSKVVFQRGKDVLDFELTELQDNIRVMMSRGFETDVNNGTGAADSGGLQCSGDNSTANLVIGATTRAFLVDGYPVRLETGTTLAIPVGTGGGQTYNVYVAVAEQEVADPSQMTQLGPTTRRDQYTLTFAATTGSVPSDTSSPIWLGGTRYRTLATVHRPASQTAIMTGDVTDLRQLSLGEFVTASMISGSPLMTIVGNVTITGVLTPGTLALVSETLSGTLTVTGLTTLNGGLTVTQSNANTTGATITGNGTGSGVNGVGGVSAQGGWFKSGTSNVTGAVQLQPQSTPSAPITGDIWYDTTAGTLCAQTSGGTKKLSNQANAAGTSSGAQNTSGSSFAAITGASATLTTLGGPVLITLQPDGTTNPAELVPTGGTTSEYLNIRLLRDASEIARWRCSSNSGSPPGANFLGSLTFVDTGATAASHTYAMQYQSVTGSIANINYVQMQVVEL